MGRAVIERKKMVEFRIRGLAEVEKDLKDFDGWDGVAKLACVALRLDGQGNIFQDILHLVGSTEPKRFDAKVIFGKDYKQDGHQVEKYDFKKIRYVQGAPKKMHHSDLYPISVLEAGFYFFTCAL